MEMRDICGCLAQGCLPDWETLPDFGLYMDQMMTYADRCLSGSGIGSGLTPAMINNYVKAGLMDRPKGKKYSRDALAQLLMIGQLKQAASMDLLLRLLHPVQGGDTRSVYEQFLQCQKQLVAEFSSEELSGRSPLEFALWSASCLQICRMMMEDTGKENEEHAVQL